MAEYIEKEALEKRIHTGMNIIEVMQTIMDTPAADVRENVRGRWVKPVPGDGEPYCSHCKREPPCTYSEGYIYTAFCPNCGADMTTDEETA